MTGFPGNLTVRSAVRGWVLLADSSAVASIGLGQDAGDQVVERFRVQLSDMGVYDSASLLTCVKTPSNTADAPRRWEAQLAAASR